MSIEQTEQTIAIIDGRFEEAEQRLLDDSVIEDRIEVVSGMMEPDGASLLVASETGEGLAVKTAVVYWAVDRRYGSLDGVTELTIDLRSGIKEMGSERFRMDNGLVDLEFRVTNVSHSMSSWSVVRASALDEEEK